MRNCALLFCTILHLTSGQQAQEAQRRLMTIIKGVFGFIFDFSTLLDCLVRLVQPSSLTLPREKQYRKLVLVKALKDLQRKSLVKIHHDT